MHCTMHVRVPCTIQYAMRDGAHRQVRRRGREKEREACLTLVGMGARAIDCGSEMHGYGHGVGRWCDG